MTLFERVRAQLKADKAKAETRAQKRREYVRAARERDRLRLLASGLASLPVVAEESAKPQTTPEPAQLDPSAEELVARLEAIKERILRLHSMFATTLAFDCAMEANRYVMLFQNIAAELKLRQPEALEYLVRRHEAILLSPPVPVRQQIPIETQRLCELQWEVTQSPIRRVPKGATEQIPDGLGWML
jgi:RNase P subunit RPR2